MAFFIPATAQDKTSEGVIIAVGTGHVLEDGSVRPLDVKAGDKILFDKYSGVEVTLNGDEYLVLREVSVVCVLEEESSS